MTTTQHTPFDLPDTEESVTARTIRLSNREAYTMGHKAAKAEDAPLLEAARQAVTYSMSDTFCWRCHKTSRHEYDCWVGKLQTAIAQAEGKIP